MKNGYPMIAGGICLMAFGSASGADQPGAGNQAAASWATMDANADGALSPEEVSGTPWEAKFGVMDSNHDNTIAKSEFGAYMTDMEKAQQADRSDDNDM